MTTGIFRHAIECDRGRKGARTVLIRDTGEEKAENDSHAKCSHQWTYAAVVCHLAAIYDDKGEATRGSHFLVPGQRLSDQ
jgi:hypothetical protein